MGRADWRRILERVIPYVDFFVPSIEELCFMLDRQRFEAWQLRSNGEDITDSPDLERDIQPLAGECMKLGAKVLMIKCGVKGMYYRTAGQEILGSIGKNLSLNVEEWKEKEGFERSYIPERVLSGTGAGDTGIAAFLCVMLEGKALESCMYLAAAKGASCVAAYDALSGLKSFEEFCVCNA